MILKYIIGNPIYTDAVIADIPTAHTFPPYLQPSNTFLDFNISLAPDDIIYGLGENVRGINKRGWKYISNCTDDPSHTEGKNSLYGAHNFLIHDGNFKYGIFIDFPSNVTFDIGYTENDLMSIHIANPNYILYVIEGESVLSIIREFRQIIGKSYLAPKWAFGHQQSRWGYKNQEDIRKVVSGYRNNHLPLDAVYMDIDYMENFKDFTIDSSAFPDFSEFVSEMKEQHIHLVPIIDAGVKIQEGYPVYEEGVSNHYFCKDENNQDFVVGVWPGNVLLPDFLNTQARSWFGKQYKFLIDQGIDGFWNDMNEPALFYSKNNLQKVFSDLKEYSDKEMDIENFFAFTDIITNISNNIDDYKSFYHNIDGQKIRHDLVHNLYGYYMTRSASEAFRQIAPDKNILLFSRSSYIGMHRYGGIWTGDNSSWWSHIELLMKMLPSLNMCGFLYTGADTGGFGDNTTEDLLIRFMELSLFTPLFRNHSALGTREQELYQFKNIDCFRNLLNIRYGLIPYLYSEYIKSINNNTLMFCPMGIQYPQDLTARHIEDQLMVGESIMIAPIYQQNSVGRYVYLPEDMVMLKFRSLDDLDQISFAKGHHYIPIALTEVVVFIRPNHMLIVGEGSENIESISSENFNYYAAPNEKCTYTFFESECGSKELFNTP